jgi:integrase
MSGAKKRGHEEGTIYERADGRWAAAVSLGYGPDGKRLRKTVYGKTRKEVAAKLVELQKSVQNGQAPTNDAVTVAQLMTAWLVESVKPSVRPRTYRSYEQLTRVHVVPHLGRERVSKVDARKIQAFLRERGEAGLSPRTVQYLRAILRRAFGQAVRWDWVSRNVVALTEPPKAETPAPRAFDQGQAQALLASFRGHRHGNLLTVLLGLGLRLGEALGLRWDDVRLNPEGTGGMVTVTFQLQRVQGAYRLVPPKSRASRRNVAVPAFVAQAFPQEEERHGARAVARAGKFPWNELGLVFTTAGISTRYWPVSGWRESGCTTCATCAPHSCCHKGCNRAWSWRFWGTPRSA